MAASRDVHLFLLHPSPARGTPTAPRRAAVRTRCCATWGNDARSMQLALAAHATGFADRPPRRDGRADHAAAPPAGATCTPTRRRPAGPRPGGPDERLRARRRRPQRRRCTPATAAPARSRSLRDAILHLLADDPTLEPRDVIVMCPDIETFAPLVHATFGADDDASTRRPPAGQLQVRLADRAAAPDEPGARRARRAARARRRAASRPRSSSTSPGSSRCGGASDLDDDELARIEDWVGAAGDPVGPRRRAPGRRTSSTAWPRTRGGPASTGCCSASAMTEDELPLVGGVLPLDDVDSGDIDLAGRLAELVDRVARRPSTRSPHRSRCTPGSTRSPPPPTR